MNTRLIRAFALYCSVSLLAVSLNAQVYERVFSFTDARAEDIANSSGKGANPSAAMVLGTDGNFYGATVQGGANENGTIFRMTADGVLTTLVDFTGNGVTNKGAHPSGELVLARDGNFYGTTSGGGANNVGTIFRMTATGVLTTLVEFTDNGPNNKGSNPNGLMQASDGNFYGTTSLGGSSTLGTIFKMTPDGTLTTLVDITAGGMNYVGGRPSAKLIEGSDGALYGVFYAGLYASDKGTIFKVTKGGLFSALVKFTGNGSSNKGSYPLAALVLGRDGRLYGTTSQGGANDKGTIFAVTMDGVLTTLVEFTGNGMINKGSKPDSPLILGSDGNFYATTVEGGVANTGTIFRVTAGGVLTTIVDFANGLSEIESGANPAGGLVQGRDGNFYGTTQSRGARNRGTAFRMTADGVLTTLVHFTGNGMSRSGRNPYAGLVQSSDGTFYGTTMRGGGGDFGTVFKLTAGGLLSSVVEFTDYTGDFRGGSPTAGLVQGRDGNFYGTTFVGGQSHSGSAFKLTPNGVFTTLADFPSAGVGNYPCAGLVEASDGTFYGVTKFGGAGDLGTIFRLTSAGGLTKVLDFTGSTGSSRGRYPHGGLVLGNDGNFYGTTYGAIGTPTGDYGSIFRMTPAGVLSTLVEFTNNGSSNKGRAPTAALIQGSDGNFYGTTSLGGGNDFGTVFKMTPDGVLTTLVEFTGNGPNNKGSVPNAALVEGKDGNFYGTTTQGGASNQGTAFMMTPGGVLTTLVEFTTPDGSPLSPLIEAADGALYGTLSGPDGAIYRLIYPGKPAVALREVTLPEPGTAVVEAQINARGFTTDLSLEYGTVSGSYSSTIPLAVGIDGFQTKLAGTTVAGLVPGTVYYYRFTAASSAGTTLTPEATFTTLAKPVVVPNAATEIAPTSARFNGTVNAGTFDTSVVFEWGTNGISFPNTAPATPGIVTGNTDVPVTAAVAGFAAGGTIFYRLRANSVGGVVVSGARSFSTVSVTTSVPSSEQVGVTDALLKATINTFGQTAAVKFKYWANSAPGTIFETLAQTVTSTGPTEVSATVTNLEENTTYSYRVSVEIADTRTDGGAVAFVTDANQPPVAVADLVFYSGQVVVDALANDYDPNYSTNANLLLDPVLVTPPNAARGIARVTIDQRFISYNPQFNVLDDDALTYRVLDPTGASATAQVRLIAFSKRAGFYGGKITFGSGETERDGPVSLQMGAGGTISTSFFNWTGQTFQIKGVFDQDGTLSRAIESSTGAVLALTLTLDADAPVIHGKFEESMEGISTTGVLEFTLTRNAGTGGLAESGLRTGFLDSQSASEGVLGDGFLRMTVGKDARRGARFAGRLPDGEPFLASAPGQGRTYALVKALEQGGVFMGLVRAIDGVDGSGMMGDLYWKKRASGRARYERGGVETTLSLAGVAYPATGPGQLPPIGLGAPDATRGNARLVLSGGNLSGSYRDLLLNILPGVVQVIGPDPAQSGPDISLNKLQVIVDARQAKFSGRFHHPTTGQLVPFEGAFRTPFDGDSGQGRGVFRGPVAAGSVVVAPQ